METKDYQKDIIGIINTHFDQAETRVDDVYASYFSSTKAVLGRHWRHKKDIPSDLMALPRHTWGFISGKIFRKKTKPLPKTGKTREIESLIADELLDLKGLEKKVEEYVKPYQEQFEQDFTDILEDIPSLQREQFTKELELHVERLNTPIEGTREAVIFLIAGIVGKVFSDKITFGSSIATGKAVATSIYMSQLSWFGSLWAHLFGVPSWVGYAGAGAGVLTALLVAPFLTPAFELGINKFRARKILRETVHAARQKLTGKSRDAVDLAGKTAIYLQVLPDLIEIAKRTAKTFI